MAVKNLEVKPPVRPVGDSQSRGTKSRSAWG